MISSKGSVKARQGTGLRTESSSGGLGRERSWGSGCSRRRETGGTGVLEARAGGRFLKEGEVHRVGEGRELSSGLTQWQSWWNLVGIEAVGLQQVGRRTWRRECRQLFEEFG